MDNKESKVEVLAKIDEKGLFSFDNHKELGTAASLLIQTGYAPNHLRKEGREAVAAALLFCKQFGLPQKAMSQLAFVKGKLTAYGSLVTALAERHPEYGDRRDFFLNADCEKICSENKNLKDPVWAAVVQIRKKGSTVWNEYFFSIDDAEQAGLLTSNTSKESGWKKYTRDLIFHKANKRALMANYASALEGVEYFEDVREVYDITPKGDSSKNAMDLNEMLMGDK